MSPFVVLGVANAIVLILFCVVLYELLLMRHERKEIQNKIELLWRERPLNKDFATYFSSWLNAWVPDVLEKVVPAETQKYLDASLQSYLREAVHATMAQQLPQMGREELHNYLREIYSSDTLAAHVSHEMHTVVTQMLADSQSHSAFTEIINQAVHTAVAIEITRQIQEVESSVIRNIANDEIRKVLLENESIFKPLITDVVVARYRDRRKLQTRA